MTLSGTHIHSQSPSGEEAHGRPVMKHSHLEHVGEEEEEAVDEEYDSSGRLHREMDNKCVCVCVLWRKDDGNKCGNALGAGITRCF